MSISGDPSSSARDTFGKHFIGRQIVDYDTPDVTYTHQDSHHPADRNRPSQVSDPDTDLYTYNSLNSFSFGTVQTRAGSSISQSVHPLSTSHHGDIGDDIYLMCPSEVTPRPSVVVDHGVDQPLIRSHPAQPSGHYGHLPVDLTSSGAHPETMNGESAADPDAHHSSGNHSRSGSIFLTGKGAENPCSGSGKRRLERTMSQTSVHDSTDEDDDHQHPSNLRSDTRNSFIGSSGTGTGNSTAVEFSSDEDYGDYDYESDYDSYDEEGMNIEVSSARFEGSVVTHDWDSGTGRESRTRLNAHNSERRGSLPMAIPGAPSALAPGDSLFSPATRNKEDNVGTLRRPSRSLDDEFRKLRLGSGANGTSMGNEGVDGLVAPPAPTSVPESDSDWKHLEERNKSKGKFQGTHGAQHHSVSSSVDRLSRAPHISSPSRVQEDFDMQDWNQSLGGIRGITSLDPRELRDIIGPNDEYSQVFKSADRRTSSANSRWLPLWGSSTRRPSTATVSTLAGDSFGRAVGRWGGDGYLAQRRDWSFRRENADRNAVILAGMGESYTGRYSITDSVTPRGSIMTERSGMSPSLGGREEADSIRNDKGMKTSSGWKGMQLEDQEIWRNDLIGRFIVSRRATRPTDSSKGPQQRLVVQHFRDGYTPAHVKHHGPPVTIHKHSKAIAFSISRRFRTPIMSYASRDASFISGSHRSFVRGNLSSNLRTEASSMGLSSGNVVPAKKSPSMILLAPRRVQEAFTNTHTTRKLNSHGLLDEGNDAQSDVKSKRRPKQRLEKGKEREKQTGRDHRKMNEDAKGKGKERQQAGDARRNIHVAGGVSQVPPSPSTSTPSSHTYVPAFGSQISVGDRSISRSSSNVSRRRHRVHDPFDHYDCDDDEKDIPPVRTPHSETYATMDASVIERLRPRQDRQIMDYDSNRSFLRRLIRGRAHPVSTLLPGQHESLYDPPWLTLVSRTKQEQQQRVVENLNTSFKDVGLLPSTHRDGPNLKPKKIATGGGDDDDVFRDIPADSLYMLLPLWPGETDPTSEYKMEFFEKPHISSEKRQYLLVCYKPLEDVTNEEHARNRGEGEGRNRSRNSATSSQEKDTKKGKTTSILLSSFRISARLTSYTALQGTGVRIPDEGLTVTGPLDVAFKTMPTVGGREYEWVLGVCHSREAGIEFYPDGMVKLGLCIPTSEPPVDHILSEEDEPQEPDVELTPVGRAVIEMAWLGAMALTSFGPGV